MRMAQHCPYASNPYHVCGKYCLQNPPRSKVLAVAENLAPKDVGLEENVEVVGRRNVDPLCGYASNPYHKCTDFCTRRNPNQKNSLKGAKSVWWSNMIESRKGASLILPFTSSEGRKERVMIMNTNNVNPSCSYASNLYHQCTQYCSQRTKEKIEIKQGNTERGSRGVGVTERKNVDPRCKYASNPYHKCTSYCSLKINQVA